MVESGYPLSRLGDVLTAFKPDLVLLGVRVDPYRERRLEDASFEMTYVDHFARQRGIVVEPIDWYRDEDIGAPAEKVEPWDATEIAKRETELLGRSPHYTFEQANGAELEEQLLLATTALVRYHGGAPVFGRRRAWMQHLSATAVARHGRPKRVLAFVDVVDRPTVDMALHTIGYATKAPTAIALGAKETVGPDVPAPVLSEYAEQLKRLRGKELPPGPLRDAAMLRARVLEVAVKERGVCCVPAGQLDAR